MTTKGSKSKAASKKPSSAQRKRPPKKAATPRKNPKPDSGSKKQALVASGRNIKIDNKAEAKIIFGLRKDWQKLAWRYFQLVGELKYAILLKANMQSRIRLYAAEVPEDSTQVPKATTNAVAIAAVKRLEMGGGSHAELLRKMSIQYDVPGECWLVGVHARAEVVDQLSGKVKLPEVRETWILAPNSSITYKNEKYTVTHAKLEYAITLDDDDFIARLWIEDPEKTGLEPDSSVRGVLSACEQLVALDRTIRSITRSKAWHSTLVAIPDDFTFGQGDQTTEGEEPEDDPLLSELMEAVATAVQDEGSAATVAPNLLRYPRREGSSDSGLEVHDIMRPLDEALDKFVDRGLRRLAQGINLPPEVVLGLGDANHWGAGQIEKSAFKEHIEPDTMGICSSLTEAYLRPTLEEANVANPERYLIWFDPSVLVVDSSRAAKSDFGYKNLLISGETWRSVNGYGEDEKMSDEEIEKVLEQISKMRAVKTTPPPGEDAPAEDTSDPTAVPEGDGEGGQESVTAAGVEPSLGEQLVEIDRTLRLRLHESSEAAMERALERAGAKLVTKAKQNGLASLVRDVETVRVASVIGPNHVRSLGYEDPELIIGAFDAVVDKATKWAKGAYSKSRKLMGLDEELTHDNTTSIQLASDWLRMSLEELGKIRLYDPNPGQVEGEFDPDTRVPMRVVREFVARAGGGPSRTHSQVAASPERALGLQVGETASWLGRGIGTSEDLMAESGMVIEAWRWVYGLYPRNTFQPHADLSNKLFLNFDDPVLANHYGFPGTAFFYPGDHGGCVCDMVPEDIQGMGGGAPKPGEPARAFEIPKNQAGSSVDTRMVDQINRDHAEVPALSEIESGEALNEYISFGHDQFNRALRGSEADYLDYFAEMLDDEDYEILSYADALQRATEMDDLLRHWKLDEDSVLFRGMRTSDMSDEVYESLTRIGTEFTDPGWMSTSAARAPAEYFAKGDNAIVFAIKTPAGTPYIPGAISEREAILPRGSMFRVVDWVTEPLEKDAGKEVTVIFLEYLGVA